MKILTIRNLDKVYQLDKNKSFSALKDVNLAFDSYGFVSIVGKSGSGKSTLLNIIAMIDSPTSGEILLNKKRYNFKKKNNYKFYRDEVGVIFQNFNLLDDNSTLYNAALPLLIRGMNKRKAFEKAKEILRYVNINEELYDVPASKLSGGEKQRVAIARAIISNPKIILCDEPTGSLDSMNSELIMQLLKRISHDRLVIMVSHNLHIVKKYSNRIIEISDGNVINDYQNLKFEQSDSKIEEKLAGHSNWTNRFSFKNFRKRLKRNLFVIASLSICMIMANLVAGFISGKDEAIVNACYKQLDFGSGTISEEEVVSNTGMLKLSKSVRPDLEAIRQITKINEMFELCPNFSAILPQNLEISYNEQTIENILYTPIYSYDEPYFDRSLIYKGDIPKYDSLDEVIINKKCYQNLKREINSEPLYETLTLYYRIETIFVDEESQYISDVFEFKHDVLIVGVADELDYLSTSKIYYSYIALENYLQEYPLINLSTYYDNKITWYDRIVNAENYSLLSSYSYQLFLKDYHLRKYVLKGNVIPSQFAFSSNSILIAESLINFLEVAKYALLLFLGISVIGAVLILSIISLTNFAEDRKVGAVLTSLGAKNSDIEDIYLNESLISGLLSLFVSLSLSIPLSLIANKSIYKYTSLENVIRIPLKSLFGVPLFYPLLLFAVVFVLVGLSTLIPIKFSRHNSLRTELQSND